MSPLFLLSGARAHHPDVAAWFLDGDNVLRQWAKPWFDIARTRGPDVTEVLHDRCPTACVDDAAFAYVAAFKGHVNIGFFHGADLPDPAGLLQGSGKRMRHVKVPFGQPVDEAAITALITAAYSDIKARLQAR